MNKIIKIDKWHRRCKYNSIMMNKYKVLKAAGRFQVVNVISFEVQSVWGDLISARKMAAQLSARK